MGLQIKWECNFTYQFPCSEQEGSNPEWGRRIAGTTMPGQTHGREKDGRDEQSQRRRKEPNRTGSSGRYFCNTLWRLVFIEPMQRSYHSASSFAPWEACRRSKRNVQIHRPTWQDLEVTRRSSNQPWSARTITVAALVLTVVAFPSSIHSARASNLSSSRMTTIL